MNAPTGCLKCCIQCLVDLGSICSFFQSSIAVLVECAVNELAIVWNLCFAFGLMAVTNRPLE